MRIFWDIETEGLPESQIAKLIPEFDAPGNIKDPAKIAAAVADKRAEWLDKCALRAITGKIVAVTMSSIIGTPTMNAGDEADLIAITVDALTRCGSAYAWNGHGFDLPFLCQRAAVHGIPAFAKLTVRVKGRYYWREELVDPKLVWSNYSPDHSNTSLRSVALALGVGEKTGNGKDFAALLKTNPAEAERYALADVTLLRDIVNRMGI